MPISITITDISTLTKTDIQELHDYLHKVWFLTPSQNIADPNVIKQELDEEVPMPKPRKKRKAKIGTPEAVFNMGDTITLNTADDTVEIETNFTYSDLISYILENTREKKITHDQIMTLVAQFDLLSLNELEKFPDKIGPFYNDLVEIVNA
jgi:hypothetical protein